MFSPEEELLLIVDSTKGFRWNYGVATDAIIVRCLLIYINLVCKFDKWSLVGKVLV